MATRRVAAVFGGTGFIGRYVVKRLAQQGYIVRIPTRDPAGALFLKPMGAVGQVVPLYASVTNEATVQRAVEGAAVAINLVGLLTESRAASFQAIHAEGAARIARLSAAAGVGRLIQVSAIGADPDSPSRYAATKGNAEQAVRAAFAGATILRPSLVFGMEDKFFNRFAGIARLAPFMPVIAGDTKMQPVFVGDVADATMAALASAATQGMTFELGGPRVWTFRELLAFILETTHRHKKLLDIPMGIARLQAAVLQYVPGKPLTPDQLLLLSHDNVVTAGAAGLAALGIAPTPVELVVPPYLRRYRPGGGRRPAIALPGEG